MNMFTPFSIVELRSSIEAAGIPAGARGAVLEMMPVRAVCRVQFGAEFDNAVHLVSLFDVIHVSSGHNK